MVQDVELGTTTKSEVLQMELSLLNAKVAVQRNRIALEDAMYNLFSYLRVTDYNGAELIPPYLVPDMCIDADELLEKAMANSAHTKELKLQMLNAEQNLAQAKANRGLQMTLNGELGFMQTGKTIGGGYRNPKDYEVIGLTLRLPIFDWGVNKGRVRMAQAQMEVIRTQQEQAHQDYVQDLRKRVMQFNAYPAQCRDALRAREIAEERYGIMKQRYEAGTVSVTDLNTAWQEMTSANGQYISQLRAFWNDYYSLQKATLYDWVKKKPITVDDEP